MLILRQMEAHQLHSATLAMQIQEPLPGFHTTSSDAAHFWNKGIFHGRASLQLVSVAHLVPLREMDFYFIFSQQAKHVEGGFYFKEGLEVYSGQQICAIPSHWEDNPSYGQRRKLPKLCLMSQRIVTSSPNGKKYPCWDCLPPWHKVMEHLSCHLRSLQFILRCMPALSTSIFWATCRWVIITSVSPFLDAGTCPNYPDRRGLPKIPWKATKSKMKYLQYQWVIYLRRTYNMSQV